MHITWFWFETVLAIFLMFILLCISVFWFFYFWILHDNKVIRELEENMYIMDIYHTEGRYIIWNRTSWPVFWGDVYNHRFYLW